MNFSYCLTNPIYIYTTMHIDHCLNFFSYLFGARFDFLHPFVGCKSETVGKGDPLESSSFCSLFVSI